MTLFKLLNLEDKPRNKNYSILEYVLLVVMMNGLDLCYASKKLRDNFDIVLAAVEQNGRALEYASERLQNDKRIVLAAVRQNGGALQFASYSMSDDEFIVHEAVTNTNHRVNCALSYASRRLQKCDYLSKISLRYTKYPRFS